MWTPGLERLLVHHGYNDTSQQTYMIGFSGQKRTVVMFVLSEHDNLCHPGLAVRELPAK